MVAFNFQPCYLVWHLLLIVPCWATTQLTFPATLEVDLIFPRNDTYAPTALMPIVFAIQNSGYAAALDVKFSWELWQGSGPDMKFIATREVDLKNADFSSNNPYFAIDSLSSMNSTESVWSFSWTSHTGNCSDSVAIEGNLVGPNITASFQNLVNPIPLVFTTKKGAKQPDLVAATADNTCANTESYSYEVSGTLNVTNSPEYDDRSSCAVLASSLPTATADPCAAKVNASVASSISAALTACASQHPTATACLLEKNDGFSKAEQFSFRGMAWLMASLVWLLHLI